MAKVKLNQVLDGPPKQGAAYVLTLPQPPVRNAEEYLKAYIGYVYTAVGAIAQDVASIDLHLFKATFTKNGPETTEIYEHPALSVINYMNTISTFYDVIEATQTYLELTGEAFWVVLKDGKGMPREIWPLRPDWVKIIPSPTEVIDHYNYYAGGVISEKVEIPKENIIPFKYFHPMNPYRGKGTVQAAALPFDILNFAGEYNRNFFFNSAIPSMIFSTDQKISEQTVKRFLNQWQQSFGGRSKSNKVAFLGQGLKLDKVSQTPQEMDFARQMEMMRDDVLAVFKVPKTIIGITSDVNKASAESTTRAFMGRVISPRMRKMVASLNEFFLPMFVGADNSYFFDFYDPAPEDMEVKLKKYESARKYTWMTPNEIRIEENMEPLPGGDDLFAPLGGGANSFSTDGKKPDGTPINPDDEGSDETDKPSADKPVSEDDEPKKPTEDKPKGIRGLIVKLFKLEVYSNKKYIVPEYLLKRMRERKKLAHSGKHMMSIPVKRLEKIEEEEMVVSFIEPLKKFIGQLISSDDYSPMKEDKTSKSKEIATNDLINNAIKELEKEKKQKEIFENKKAKHIAKLMKEGSGWTQEQKAAYWEEFIKSIIQREKKLKENCQQVFNDQKEMVLERLNDSMKSWRRRIGMKATATQVVPSKEELNLMWKTLVKILKDIYIEQGNATLDFLGSVNNINITTEFASQYLVEYGGQLISGIDDTTRNALMVSLSEGFDKGESIGELSERVRDIFTTADETRAEMIARTEAIRASNAASVEAYRQSGVVVAKEWLAEMDERTCPFCEHLDGKSIPLDDNYFDKGDSLTVGDNTMSFDYMDVGEPPAHVDCRCTTIPVLDTTKE